MSNLIKKTIRCLEIFFPLEMCILVLNFVVLFCFVFIYWHNFIPHFRKSTKSIFPVAD